MRVWRIAPDTPDYGADDRSGTGAKRTGGRWNRPGLPVLYCADTPSLACLETLVHLGAGSLPLNRYLVAVDIPDAVWVARQARSPSSLPAGWDAHPFGPVSLDLGDTWLKSNETAVLEVPSAIVPEDSVLLINPRHADSARIASSKIRRWTYDPRLL
ncbi:MAG: RES family NAD+ phosphorylase [Acidiferrobacteraceae bacterium]